MDPFIVASLFKQPLYFLAKGALFNSAFKRWFLGNMNMIPIFRAQDLQEANSTPEQMKVQNQAVFQQCFDFLKKKGSLLIFPEGTSVSERRLRDIKSGTARIALGAEADNNFELGLCIQPVGLNYTNSHRFRSRVFVSCAEPISLKNYQSLYEVDPSLAIKKLTEDTRLALENEMLIVNSPEEDLAVQQIEKIYKAAFATKKQKEMGTEGFLLTQEILKAYRYFNANEPERTQVLRQKIQRYFGALDRLKLKDSTLAEPEGDAQLWSDTLKSSFLLIIGFPLYLFGLVNNYLPYILPSYMANWLTKEKEYTAPIMMSSGILSFSIFYALQIWLCHYLLENFIYTLIYSTLLPLTAFWAMYYTARWQSIYKRITLWGIFYSKSTLISQLLAQRQDILQHLAQARSDYEKLNL